MDRQVISLDFVSLSMITHYFGFKTRKKDKLRKQGTGLEPAKFLFRRKYQH